MRGRDKHWDVRKYKGDGAFYAFCKCGWYYVCGDILNHKEDSSWMMYKYCPCCGAHKKFFNPVPKKMEKEFPWM